MRSKKETDEVQLRKDDALNQFISELSSNIHGRRYSELPTQSNVVERKEQQNTSVDSDATKLENSNDKIITSDSAVVGESERRKSSDLLAQPSHFVTVIEVKESSNKTPEAPATTTTSSSSSFKSIRSGYENVIIENNKRNSNLISEMDRSSNTTSFNSNIRPSAPPIANIQDAKKKIPPR
jgi:hypothetical protein